MHYITLVSSDYANVVHIPRYIYVDRVCVLGKYIAVCEHVFSNLHS